MHKFGFTEQNKTAYFGSPPICITFFLNYILYSLINLWLGTVWKARFNICPKFVFCPLLNPDSGCVWPRRYDIPLYHRISMVRRWRWGLDISCLSSTSSASWLADRWAAEQPSRRHPQKKQLRQKGASTISSCSANFCFHGKPRRP